MDSQDKTGDVIAEKIAGPEGRTTSFALDQPGFLFLLFDCFARAWFALFGYRFVCARWASFVGSGTFVSQGTKQSGSACLRQQHSRYGGKIHARNWKLDFFSKTLQKFDFSSLKYLSPRNFKLKKIKNP